MSSFVADPSTEPQYFGLRGLDRKIENYLPYRNGFFVELGANDGVQQSNTLYFERNLGWRGVLIEPILHNFQKCVENRGARSRVYLGACVSFGYNQPYVELTYSDLATTPHGVDTDLPDIHAQILRSEEWMPVQTTAPYFAPATTLNDILDLADAPGEMDLLSLDVEGAELEVLKGLDHDRFRFRYLVVECRNLARATQFLDRVGYHLIEPLSHHDYIFAG